MSEIKNYTEDDIYPNIGFKVWTEVMKLDSKWKWKVWLVVVGPDDSFMKASNYFSSKKEATDDLLLTVTETINDLLRQAGE